jgi:hypothetical protein
LTPNDLTATVSFNVRYAARIYSITHYVNFTDDFSHNQKTRDVQ